MTTTRPRVPSTTTRVLIVDDDHEDRMLVVAALERVGKVRIIERGRLGGIREALLEIRPDIILLDLHLPDSTPRETLECAGALATGLPVVVLTGSSDTATAARVLASGVQDFVSKSDLSPALLERTIRHARERHQAAQERVRMLAAMERRDRAFRLSAELSSDAIVRIVHRRSGGEVAFVNRTWERLTGLDLQALAKGGPGRLLDAFHPEDRTSAELIMLTRRPVLESASVRVLSPAEDDDLRHVELAVVRIPGQGLEAPESLVTLRDVTAHELESQALRTALEHEKAASQRSEQAAALRNVLLQATSHELRTPVTVVLAASEILRRHHDRLSPEHVRAYTDQVTRHARRLHDRIEDLFLLAGSSGVASEDRKRLGSVSASVALDVSFGERRITFDHCSPDLRVPAALIRRLLARLLDNVVRHTPPECQVIVTTRIVQEHFVLRVEDTGGGFTPEALDRCGCPLELAASSVTDANPGMGLGLPVVRALAESLDGSCDLGNHADGGAFVEVLLPLTTVFADAKSRQPGRTTDTTARPATDKLTTGHQDLGGIE